MPTPLAQLTTDTPGIVEVCITDLIEDPEHGSLGLLKCGVSLVALGALTPQATLAYDVSAEVLSGYVMGLFLAHEAGDLRGLDLIYFYNDTDNVRVRFDCRSLLRSLPAYA
ncbi:hypothetical protein FAES_3654 [Fibrella aestuarina BUZ 2]|uniref:Uncharacterized protein n=1 Tax=Fibrella aestuarina BUZ 2 TaxID=1166018 RepID=I0KC08_9BACT|nr:hypothetical protein [Fibrella aestuarina]CCH01661.1 hypothetical protein FAES_3654 [Fibrella aestuarina BUZ 2]